MHLAWAGLGQRKITMQSKQPIALARSSGRGMG
jgi:hypothetical protein